VTTAAEKTTTPTEKNGNSREKKRQHPLTTATGKIKMFDNSKKPGTDLFNEVGSGRFFISGSL
jgi:hypothetical protein